jgi:hypothetical protein
MRKLIPLFALGLLAACPEQLGQQCPPNTLSVGQYTLGFAGQHPAGECAAIPDGGDAATPLAGVDAGLQLGATFCLGSGGSDGGPRLAFIAGGKQPRYSDLLTDGGFHFTGHSVPIPGTACVCAVAIDESFDGYLQTTPAGPVSLQPDGGLPLITSVAGTIVDNLSTPSGTTGCACTLPCPVSWGITGVRF